MARTPLLHKLQQMMRQQLASRMQNSNHSFPSVTRRGFIAGAGAVGLTAALPSTLYAAKPAARIAIVGAGMAGLNCALTLGDKGIHADIFEASSRVGGRMFSNSHSWNEGQGSEWCGELIDTGHKAVRQLAKRFHLPLDDLLAAQPEGSEDTNYLLGSYYSMAQATADFQVMVDVVADDLKAAGYPTTYDDYTEAGKALDEMSIAQWIDTRVPGGHGSLFGQLLDLAYNIEFGAECTDQSALNLLYLLGYQPNPKGLAMFGESDERFHIRGGNEQLPKVMAIYLGEDRIRFQQRLTRIAQAPQGGYALTFAAQNGSTQTLLYDLVVLAIPFAVLRNIDYSQAGFDDRKHQAIQELGRGQNGKTQLQFASRIWNEEGPWPAISTGASYSDTGYQASWEVTRAQPGTSGILNFYSGGNVAASMQSTRPFATQTDAAANADITHALQQAELVYPGLTEQWNGKATQSLPHLSSFFGASYAYYRVGQYTAFGGYEGVTQGGVMFCGEHTSMDFQGYMEGAAVEGERAGKELMGLVLGNLKLSS